MMQAGRMRTAADAAAFVLAEIAIQGSTVAIPASAAIEQQPVTVQQLNPTTDPPGGNCQDPYSSGTGFQGVPQAVHDTVDLSAFDGQTVELRFNLTTNDSLYNDFEGWYVKNIKVTGTASGSPVTVFSDPVADGDAMFTASSEFGTAPGWHVTDRRDATLGGPAWWYGNDATGTYQSPNPVDDCTDSSANAGTITSAPFTLASSNSQLSFDTLWQIESVNPSSYDLMQVQVIPVPGPVLGLGDSVAAGYGLGASEGKGDNPLAYPLLLAGALGVQGTDLAVEGACASSAEHGCPGHSVNWQISHVPSGFTPGIVTLTVGANDIDFSDCFREILNPKNPDLLLTSGSDPCSQNSLTPHLAALKEALTTDLTAITGMYPHAKILMMNYYNPFPAPPGPADTPCLLSQSLALAYAHAHGVSWAEELTSYFLAKDAFLNLARAAQTRLYTDAQSIIDQLNSTIDAVAAAGNATVVGTSDLEGHGFCAASGSQLIFLPTLTVDASLTVSVPLLGTKTYTDHLSFSGDTICPAPVPKAEVHKMITDSFHKKNASGSVTITFDSNCLPHPNSQGQADIANDFLQQGG